jgi:5,6-dimethylbenzimidazole synthase
MTEFSEDFRDRLNELFVSRRDVRSFRQKPLAAGALERLLKVIRLAPSVGLSEPWRIVMVDDITRRAAIRRNFELCNAAALQSYDDERGSQYARLKLAGLSDAPCHLAIFADHATCQGHGLGRQTMPETIDYSVVAAIHTLWLASRAEGIGMGWVSILDPAQMSETLDVPPGWKFIGYFCLGYPLEQDDTPQLERQGWERRQAETTTLFRR